MRKRESGKESTVHLPREGQPEALLANIVVDDLRAHAQKSLGCILDKQTLQLETSTTIFSQRAEKYRRNLCTFSAAHSFYRPPKSLQNDAKALAFLHVELMTLIELSQEVVACSDCRTRRS